MSLDSRMVRGAGSMAGVLLGLAVLVAGCGTEPGDGEPSGTTSSPSASVSASPSEPTGRPASSPSAEPSPSSPARPPARRGVDASHHQGVIDWGRVRRDRIDFAYLKATEGSTFTDPRFVANARGAQRAGLRVGGYHYFSLCSPGEPQAAHFSDVLASAPARTMPPAVDLELGDCADPPPRADLLREVRAFIEAVEQQTGQRVVVYAYPDLEARYRVAEALDRRLWVRRIGSTPPEGEWWLWQRDDHASIDGISGPADLNVLAP